MATTKARWPDPKTALDKARRGIIDETTASVEILDVPNEEILRAEGLTEVEARRLAEPTETDPETMPNGRAMNRRQKPRVHQI